jgi:hypothetical protein
VRILLEDITGGKGTDVSWEMCSKWLQRNEANTTWQKEAAVRIQEVKLQNDCNPCAVSLAQSDRVRIFNACYDAWRGKRGMEDHDFWSCPCLPPTKDIHTFDTQTHKQKCVRCRVHELLTMKVGCGISARLFDLCMYVVPPRVTDLISDCPFVGMGW